MMRRVRLRQVWWTVHRWIGIGLLLLLVPIAVSGALLVYHDEFDALINPKRWAVSGPDLALSSSQYMARATEAASNEIVTGLRFPKSPGHPVVVLARQQVDSASRQRPRLISIYLDPPTGAVLDKVDFRSSLVGFLHIFHENLTVPQYSGRQIVGWVGVGMLILSLTGIWLWWPRREFLLALLRWGRTPHVSNNLHHLLGFWISIPLAIVSLTGIYLSFPQTARTLTSAIAPMQPKQQRSFAAAVLDRPSLTADEALRLAQQAAEPNARAASLFLPTVQARSKGAKRDGAERAAPSPMWRVQLRDTNHNLVTITVDDRGGAARRLPDPLAGNRAAQWIRWIHDGSRGGPVWQFVVFLTGVFPAIFAVTGLLMWWRGRRARKRPADAPMSGQENWVAAE
jgi:uncharacterized iron-regulated membrane protein